MAIVYEAQRLANIEKARALLASLDIKPIAPPKQTHKKVRVDQSKKRGVPREEPTSDSENEGSERPAKLKRVETDDGNVLSVRRSARNKGKTTNYNEDGDSSAAAVRALPRVVSAKARAGMQGAPRETMIRKHDP